MFLDGRKIADGSQIEADICVLGAGAAGLTIVGELLSMDAKIAVIESGDMEFDPDTQDLYQGSADSPDISVTRQRFFGGSTNCWMGRCRPLDELDFERRDWVGGSGWPINVRDLEGYYNRAAQNLGIWPYRDFFDESWETRLYPGQFFANIKADNSRVLGWPFVQVREDRLRLGPKYSDPIKKSANVTAYLNSNVVSLHVNDSKIDHAIIRTLAGNQFKVSASFFVLALGGLENPRILLLSNDHEVDGIGNRFGMVGRYFMGHPQTETGELAYLPGNICLPKETIGAPIGQLFFRLTDDVQRSEKLLNAGLWVYREVSKGEYAFRIARRDILQGRIPDRIGQSLVEIMSDLGDVGETIFCNIQNKRKRSEAWKFWIQTEQEPNSNNRVFLSSEMDSLGQRKLNVRRTYSELDRRTALRTSEIFAAELTRQKIARVKLDDRYKDFALFSGEQDGTFGHDMGTTRMSASAHDGVVDSQCRIHGYPNLYVGGSSVFPTSGFANPTMTIIALAIRIADNLKREMKLGSN